MKRICITSREIDVIINAPMNTKQSDLKKLALRFYNDQLIKRKINNIRTHLDMIRYYNSSDFIRYLSFLDDTGFLEMFKENTSEINYIDNQNYTIKYKGEC